MTNFESWFKTFIEEKNLPYVAWEIDVDGEIHYIDSNVVEECILLAPAHEQAAIKNMIVKIDFKNGDVNDYFRFLAESMIRTQRKAA